MNTNTPSKCDVVVIGGGPAGSIASGILAKKGYNVVVLEKEKFPRNTVGESLIPTFWKFTDLIDASEDIENEGFLQKTGGVVSWGGKVKTVSFKSFGIDRKALHVERDRFDEILLNKVRKLGANVLEEMKVTSIDTSNPQEAIVKYTHTKNQEPSQIKATYVIDASGQQAIFSKQRRTRVFDKDFGFQAVWGYFDKSYFYDKNLKVRSFEERYENGGMTAVSEIGNWGWSWKIMLREKVSVGIILSNKHQPRFKTGGTTLEERFDLFSKGIPLVGNMLSESTLIPGSVKSIRDYAYQSTKLVLDNCFLAGDAAAFVDPISSEGVPVSMYGGYLAAWAISNSLKKPHRKEFYKNTFAQEYNKRLKIFKILAYPSKQIPDHLFKLGQKIIHSFSEQELLLILAQSNMTGRFETLNKLLGSHSVSRDVKEVGLVEPIFL
ncbi:NAD(P)/FAD-dependent oxidoreductase [Dokdonia ponticola]|uniref:NAD(P)/FAD-dependent oxidoreductase n=1 Tax=Dokdonia ponticola TaxID=2041041 RepID=A0ABV9HXN4_9FLAO